MASKKTNTRKKPSRKKTSVPKSQVDVFNEMDEGQDTVPETVAEKPAEPAKAEAPATTKVNFEFPAGTDPKVIQATMAQMGRLTQKHAEDQEGISEGRAQYIRECKKRYVCVVNSLRPGWDHFEMIISNPTNDKPVPCRGRCGVILEEGLTKYVIDQLNNTHDHRTEKGRSMTIEQILAVDTAMVIDMKAVKQYHYRVDIIEEVENPKMVGQKIGAY